MANGKKLLVYYLRPTCSRAQTAVHPCPAPVCGGSHPSALTQRPQRRWQYQPWELV